LPLLWHGIEEKFCRLTAARLTPGKRQAIVDGVLALAQGEAGPLFAEMPQYLDMHED